MPAHSKRTPEMVEAILEGMSKGQTLTSLCRSWDLHPTTWNDWCAADEGLGIAHAHARDAGYDAIASALRETARGTGESTQDVQRDKLIIETDLKLLAKWDPKRYGDKTETVATVRHELVQLTPDEANL